MTTDVATPKKKVLIPEEYRPVFGAAIFFLVMMVGFIVAAPEVFLTVGIYTAIFLSLPLFTIVGLSLVYITAAGEIDLSFPSIIAISALAFTWTLEQTNLNFPLAISASLLTGIACGWINGLLVTRLGLSSLITTLGMNFALVGLTNILNNGVVRGITDIDDSRFRAILVGSWGPMPAQIERTKTLAFILIGVCSSLTGIFAVLLNSTFFPTMGDGYLLPTLAAVFVGGTAVTGGKGTIGGLVIGAATVVFIQTGVVAAGLDGYWTSFGFGLVIVLSLIGHRRFSGKLTR